MKAGKILKLFNPGLKDQLTSIEVNLRTLLQRAEEIKKLNPDKQISEELKRIQDKIYELSDILERMERELEL